MAAIMQEIGKRKRQATGIFIPHPQISPTDSSISDPRKPVQAQRKFAQGSGNLMGLIVPSNDQLLLNGSISESEEEEEDECSSFPTDNVKNKTEEFISFLSFRGTDVLPDHLKHFNRPFGIKIPLAAKLSPTFNESKSVLQQKKDGIAKWQTNGRGKTCHSNKADASPTKKLLTTPIMKIKSRLHGSFSSTNSRKNTSSHINITSTSKTRKLSGGANDSCLEVKLHPIDATQFLVPKLPASLRNQLFESTDKSPQRTTVKLSPYKRVTRSFAFAERIDGFDLADEPKSAIVEKKAAADELTLKVAGKKTSSDRSKRKIAERKASSNHSDSDKEFKISEKKAARHRSISTDVEKKAFAEDSDRSVKRKASTEKSTMPTTVQSLLHDKMKEPDKFVNEHPPRLARKTKEMATVFMSVINSGLPFQKSDSYSASSSGSSTPVALPARYANKRPSLPDSTPISPKAKKKRSLSDIQDHIEVKAHSVCEPRPTRRTKEAATIFMSELTKRLLHGDRESDDESSFIECYPELPRQRDCNSNKKTELPQLITKRRSSIIARFSENNDSMPKGSKVKSENKKPRKERATKSDDHSETKSAVSASDAKTIKILKCVATKRVSERASNVSRDSKKTQNATSQCVSKCEEMINTCETKRDNSDMAEKLLEEGGATLSSKKVISKLSQSLQINTKPSKSEIEMREKIAIAFERNISSKNRPKNNDKSKTIGDDQGDINNGKNVSPQECNTLLNKNKLRFTNDFKNGASSDERTLKTNKSRCISDKSQLLQDENVKITLSSATPTATLQTLLTSMDEAKIGSENVSESNSILVDDQNSKEPREVNEIMENDVSDINVKCEITLTTSSKPGTTFDEISKEGPRENETKMNDLGDRDYISNTKFDNPVVLCQKLNLDGNEFGRKTKENEITTKKTSDVASKNKEKYDIPLVPRIILNSIDKKLADKAKASEVTTNEECADVPVNSVSMSKVFDINSGDDTKVNKLNARETIGVNSDDNLVCDFSLTSCAKSNEIDENLKKGVQSIVSSNSCAKSNKMDQNLKKGGVESMVSNSCAKSNKMDQNLKKGGVESIVSSNSGAKSNKMDQNSKKEVFELIVSSNSCAKSNEMDQNSKKDVFESIVSSNSCAKSNEMDQNSKKEVFESIVSSNSCAKSNEMNQNSKKEKVESMVSSNSCAKSNEMDQNSKKRKVESMVSSNSCAKSNEMDQNSKKQVFESIVSSNSCAKLNEMDQNSKKGGIESIVSLTSYSKSSAIDPISKEVIKEMKMGTNEMSDDSKLDNLLTICSKEDPDETKPAICQDSCSSLRNEVTSLQKLNICAPDSSFLPSSNVEKKLSEPTSVPSGLSESSAKMSSTAGNKTLRFDYLDMKKELISKAKGEKKDQNQVNATTDSKERPASRVKETNAFNIVKNLLQRRNTGHVVSKLAAAKNISTAGAPELNISSCDTDDSCIRNDTEKHDALYGRDLANVEEISIDAAPIDASKNETVLEVDASIVANESAQACDVNENATPEPTTDNKTVIPPAFPDINHPDTKSDISQTVINNRIDENDDVLKIHYTHVFGSNNVVRTSKFSSKKSDHAENSNSETSTKTDDFSEPEMLKPEFDYLKSSICDYNEETDDLSKIDYFLASSSSNLLRATSGISTKTEDDDFNRNKSSESLTEIDDLPKCGESERMLYEEKCAKYLEENIKIQRPFGDCSFTDEKFCKPISARNLDDKSEENYLEVESLPSTDSDVFSGYKTPTKSVASPASSTKSSNFSFKYDSGILSPSSSCLRDNGSGTESRDDLSSNDEASSPSTRKRVIFQQRRPLASRLQEIKENVRLKTLAFSPHNEKSVYAFEPELPEDGPALGRKAGNSEGKKSSSKTSKLSVKVKSSAKKMLKCSSPIDDSCESADSVGNESQLFYIPLEASTGVGKSQTLIQGVALKLGTKGPDQKLVMSATIVTKSPDTFTTGTVATTISPSMLGGDQLHDVIRMSTMHPLERKKYKAPPPVAIVQPTTRVKDDAKAPTNSVTRSLEDARSFTSDIRSSPPTTKRTAHKHKPTTPAKREKNINSPSSSVRNNWSSAKKHSQTVDSLAPSSAEEKDTSKQSTECQTQNADQNSAEKVSSVAEGISFSGEKTLAPSSEENSAIRSAVTRVRKQLLHSLQEDSLQPNVRGKKKRPEKDLGLAEKSNDKKVKKMKCETGKECSVSVNEGQLTEAPVFYPNAEEFQNPMDYIESITEKAQRFGICKICPPASFKPECRVVDEMRFMAYNQYVHKMLKRWGPNLKELMVIKKYLETQDISFNELPLVGGMEIDLPRLYHTVKELGGLKEVIEERKWQEVAEKMKISKLAHDRLAKLDDIYCRYLLPYSTLSKEERNKLFLQVEKEWKTYSKEDVKNEFFEEVDECILKGKTIPLSTFYRIARNTMFMWGSKVGEEAQTDEQIEESFWNLVSKRKSHVCVHSGSIDCGTFGYGFPVSKNSALAKHPWNLKVFTNNEASILRYLSPIIGVTVPTLHVGMLYSAGCWFRDPHGLPWVEYLHTGGSKIWYGISDSSNEQFREVMECMVPQYCRPGKVWLPSDTVMVPPECLTSRGLNLSRVVQHPGEFILVFPKAFTSTVSTGYIVSESVYFAQASWLDFAEQIFQDMRDSNEPSIFSLEQLLINIANDSRSQVQLLQKILPLLNDMRDSELALRSQLKEFDLNKVETIDRCKKRKTNKIKNDEEDDYECDKCRRSLFVSMVKNSNTGADYCLLHAVKYLYKRRSQAKNCTMIYFYTKEELQNIIKNVTRRVEGSHQRETETVANITDK